MTVNQAINKVRRLLRKMQDSGISYGFNDGVVLVEDGKETNNVYELWALREPDTKTPTDWVRGIFLFRGSDLNVDFKIKTEG